MKNKKPTGKEPKHRIAASSQVRSVSFGCRGDNTCGSTPPKPHLKPGAAIDLHATNTDVTITFRKGESPFTPNVPVIQLKQGETQTFVVSPDTPNPPAQYFYQIECASGCPVLAGDPEMIVP